MEEMPSSWWDRRGYRTCILIVFLFFAIIATVCCSLSFFLANEQKETLLDTSGNVSRIQRATTDIGNGAVVNGVSVDGTSKTENGQSYPIDPHIPTVAITAKEYDKKDTMVQKNPNFDRSTKSKTDPGLFNEDNTFIDTLPNNDLGDTNPSFDTPLKPDPDSDLINIETNQKSEDKYFDTESYLKNEPKSVAIPVENNNYDTISENHTATAQETEDLSDPRSVDDHRFALRSVETASNSGSDAASSLDLDIDTNSVSNETIPDVDPTWKNYTELDIMFDEYNTSTTDDESFATTESIVETDSAIPPLEEGYIENGPIARPLTAAVEQLELPTSFGNHMNTEQKFFLKKSKSAVLDKLHLRSIARLMNVVKKSFVGYPSYYGLWYKSNPFRERDYYKESLHKSNEFEDIPLSLVMDNVLNRMASVDGSRIDTSHADQPLYARKFLSQFANPMPQDPTEMGSSSSTPGTDGADSSSSPLPGEAGDQQTTSTTLAGDGESPSEAGGQQSTVAAPKGDGEEDSGQQSTSAAPKGDGETSSTPGDVSNDQQSTSAAPKGDGEEESGQQSTSAAPKGDEETSSTTNDVSSDESDDYSEDPGDIKAADDTTATANVDTGSTYPATTTSVYEPVSPMSSTTEMTHPSSNSSESSSSCEDSCESSSSCEDSNSCESEDEDDDCSGCDIDCDISMDFSCEEQCRLQNERCLKNVNEASLSEDTKILKKNDARVKRDASSMEHPQILGGEPESMKKFDLFSILGPKREDVRDAL